LFCCIVKKTVPELKSVKNPLTKAVRAVLGEKNKGYAGIAGIAHHPGRKRHLKVNCPGFLLYIISFSR
jgi:hypothetical protein